MELSPLVKLQKGTFLIASPEIESGLFSRGVILICEYTIHNSFGLLINKPLDFELPEEIMSVHHITNPRVSMRTGGPVQTNQMMLLHTYHHDTRNVLEITEGVYLGGSLHLLQEMLASDTSPYVTLCFGYTGWTDGQLEREFLDGSWLIYPANQHYIFEVAPEKLWQTLLRDMGGKYATLSMIPEDLSVN